MFSNTLLTVTIAVLVVPTTIAQSAWSFRSIDSHCAVSYTSPGLCHGDLLCTWDQQALACTASGLNIQRINAPYCETLETITQCQQEKKTCAWDGVECASTWQATYVYQQNGQPVTALLNVAMPKKNGIWIDSNSYCVTNFSTQQSCGQSPNNVCQWNNTTGYCEGNTLVISDRHTGPCSQYLVNRTNDNGCNEDLRCQVQRTESSMCVGAS
eukprot:Pgem_evm1s5790